MQRQAKRPVPRWKRGRQQHTSMPVQLRGRHAKALTRELIKAGQQPAKGGREGTVTANGMHVLAFLGNGLWIEADPGEMKVLRVKVPSNNPWFSAPVQLVRWCQLM